MKENMMVPMSDAQAIVSSVENASGEIFHSFPVETHEDKMKLYSATSAEGVTLKSCVNKKIKMSDVVIMPVEVKNDDGTQGIVPRSTIITEDGQYITATSWGVFNSLKRVSAIFGGLHFEKPLVITPVEVKTKNGFTLNLNLA